jgi:hypothetical protein
VRRMHQGLPEAGSYHGRYRGVSIRKQPERAAYRADLLKKSSESQYLSIKNSVYRKGYALFFYAGRASVLFPRLQIRADEMGEAGACHGRYYGIMKKVYYQYR